MATISDDGIIKIWNTANGKELLTLEEDVVTAD